MAIEAKGFSVASISRNRMKGYLSQSSSGEIPVSFSAASVSHNLYYRTKCKYHETGHSNINYDKEEYLNMCKIYYAKIKDYNDPEYFNISEKEYEGITFLNLELKEEFRRTLFGGQLFLT